jgi:acyl carrier protein
MTVAAMLQQAHAAPKLIKLVEGILAKNAPHGNPHSDPIPIDRDLVDIGMTSVDMVSLMLAVEAAFDVMIPATDITPQNFRSIAAIDALVARLGSSPPPMA